MQYRVRIAQNVANHALSGKLVCCFLFFSLVLTLYFDNISLYLRCMSFRSPKWASGRVQT